MQKLTRFLQAIPGVLGTWAHFGAMLFITAISIPYIVAMAVVFGVLPIAYLVIAFQSSPPVTVYMLIVFVAVVAWGSFFGFSRESSGKYAVRRGRRVTTETHTFTQSSGTVRPISRMKGTPR